MVDDADQSIVEVSVRVSEFDVGLLEERIQANVEARQAPGVDRFRGADVPGVPDRVGAVDRSPAGDVDGGEWPGHGLDRKHLGRDRLARQVVDGGDDPADDAVRHEEADEVVAVDDRPDHVLRNAVAVVQLRQRGDCVGRCPLPAARESGSRDAGWRAPAAPRAPVRAAWALGLRHRNIARPKKMKRQRAEDRRDHRDRDDRSPARALRCRPARSGPARRRRRRGIDGEFRIGVERFGRHGDPPCGSHWRCCAGREFPGRRFAAVARRRDQRKTTVFWPFRNTRRSRCQRTARASARHSTSRPSATRSSARMLYSTRATSWSMIGPSSRSLVT